MAGSGFTVAMASAFALPALLLLLGQVSRRVGADEGGPPRVCGCPAAEAAARAEELFEADDRLALRATGDEERGFGLFARRALEPGEVLLHDGSPPLQHAFADAEDYSQDAALEEALREFLRRGGKACKKRKKRKCAAWRAEASALFALHPANRGYDPSVLLRFSRYWPLAQALASEAPSAALRGVREAACCEHDPSALLLLLAVLRSNSFTIADAPLVENLGSVVSIPASFFNHECRPNAKVQPGRQLTVRAIEPIAEGEEVVISYLGLWRLEEEREADLDQFCAHHPMLEGRKSCCLIVLVC